jgi:hypothetical protein
LAVKNKNQSDFLPPLLIAHNSQEMVANVAALFFRSQHEFFALFVTGIIYGREIIKL